MAPSLRGRYQAVTTVVCVSDRFVKCSLDMCPSVVDVSRDIISRYRLMLRRP
jgi:hypothetical protein